MQDCGITECFISSLLSFPPLSTSCQPVELKNYEEKPNPAIFDLFMCLFLYLFYTPSARRVPGCALPFDPTARSMTIVLLLLIEIRQNDKKNSICTRPICSRVRFNVSQNMSKVLHSQRRHQRSSAHPPPVFLRHIQTSVRGAC